MSKESPSAMPSHSLESSMSLRPIGVEGTGRPVNPPPGFFLYPRRSLLLSLAT